MLHEQIVVVDASIVVDLLARFRPEPGPQAIWALAIHMEAQSNRIASRRAQLRSLPMTN